MTELHVWGDSIAVGITYNESRKRYALSKERCLKRLSGTLPCKVVNHSKMGATVMDGLTEFEAFTPVPGALCVLEYGGNDCNMDWRRVAENPEDSLRANVEISAFAAKLEEFIGKITSKNMEALLITPLPLHSERFFHWVTQGIDREAVRRVVGDIQNIYSWQERYATAVRNAAQKTGTRLLDLRDAMLSRNDYAPLICIDGMHPSDKGYRFLSEYLIQLVKPQ